MRDIREQLACSLRMGAGATRFLYELAGHWCQMPQSFGAKPMLVDVRAVIEQIGEMESARNSRAVTSNAASRLDGLLEGLWHKHWCQVSFMSDNLANEMEKHGKSFIMRRLAARYGRDWDSQIDTEMVELLADASVFGGLDHRP